MGMGAAMDDYEDARSLPDGAAIEADLCIVGGGAAGITLARELARTGMRICLLEAGGLSIDPDVDAASVVESQGYPYGVEHKRLRYFGGSTNHWGGHCLPFEPDDFEAKDWVDWSGWPYGYATLEPYYRRAHEVLMLGEYDYDPARLAGAVGARLMPFEGPRVVTQMSRYNPVRFSFDYGEALAAEPNVRVLLYAEVTDIRLDDATGRAVSHLVVRTPAGNAAEVRARYFVLAAGGIEIPRMLLVANDQRPAGLGNENDLVGRFFQEHLWYESGTLAPFDPADVHPIYVTQVPYAGDVGLQAHLILTPETVAAERIGKFRTEFVSDSLQVRRIEALRDGRIAPADAVALAADPYGFGQALACRRRGALHDAYVLFNNTEQLPNPASRVRLGSDRDAYGRPQAVLDWRILRQDYDCLLAGHRILAEEAGRLGYARMRIEIDPDPDPDEMFEGVLGAGHHMGTARMSDDPATGVCTPDGRLHSVANLWVAGSALFPTSGYANPTLTIVAMTLKLSDHLQGEARKDGLI